MIFEGQRFGSLTVIALSPRVKGRHPTAICKCGCGNVRVVRLTNLRTACIQFTCASCAIRNGLRNKSRRYYQTCGPAPAITRLINWYKTSAMRKGISFALSKEEAHRLFSGNCYYCGAAPARICKGVRGRVSFPYNGIDRKDNSIGYTQENCVSCCTRCNYAKRELNIADFLTWIARVHAHINSVSTRARSLPTEAEAAATPDQAAAGPYPLRLTVAAPATSPASSQGPIGGPITERKRQ